MGHLTFKELTSDSDIKSSFEIMRELRQHLDLDRYLALIERARTEGYHLLGIYQDDHRVGLMGYRVLTDLVHGRHIYIDDLVISAKFRNHGLGAKVLDHAQVLARELGCARLRLCTGIENKDGMRFYERAGWEQRAVVYKRKLSE